MLVHRGRGQLRPLPALIPMPLVHTPEVVLQRFLILDGEHSEAKMNALHASTVFYGFAFRLPFQNAKERNSMRQFANRKEIAKMPR